ncbi:MULTISPECIES: hypothetical protein [unclassified Streptomyces]|uniref:hypothetical protein n=1 Tax=unclassified Streptomyces TaxID=2593676 RepID=UPI00131C70AB|nr:hypothetical protein [Streptomyces sp. NRRL F-5727]
MRVTTKGWIDAVALSPLQPPPVETLWTSFAKMSSRIVNFAAMFFQPSAAPVRAEKSISMICW